MTDSGDKRNSEVGKFFLRSLGIHRGVSGNLSKKLFVLALLISISCNRDLTDDPIPFISFAPYTVTLYLPEFQSLMLDGGYKQINSIGVQGVILYRVNSTSYRAYEKNCSYHPAAAGATIDVHPSKLYLFCSGCGSTFNFTDGMPSGGVAWRPLRRYNVELTAPTLTITNEIIN